MPFLIKTIMLSALSDSSSVLAMPFNKQAVTQNNNALFSLTEKERRYIISQIQTQISKLSKVKIFESPDEAKANHRRILELIEVLETFHIQKTWSGNEHS